MKLVMDVSDVKNVIKDLQEKPFICGQNTIETESGYVIKKKLTNADRIRSMCDEELEAYRASVFSGDMTQTMLKEQYNKAIDDFTEKIIRYVDCGHLCSPTEIRWSDLAVVEMVKKIAEQLKKEVGE